VLCRVIGARRPCITVIPGVGALAEYQKAAGIVSGPWRKTSSNMGVIKHELILDRHKDMCDKAKGGEPKPAAFFHYSLPTIHYLT
jgi:hypothetical protein